MRWCSSVWPPSRRSTGSSAWLLRDSATVCATWNPPLKQRWGMPPVSSIIEITRKWQERNNSKPLQPWLSSLGADMDRDLMDLCTWISRVFLYSQQLCRDSPLRPATDRHCCRSAKCLINLSDEMHRTDLQKTTRMTSTVKVKIPSVCLQMRLLLYFRRARPDQASSQDTFMTVPYQSISKYLYHNIHVKLQFIKGAAIKSRHLSRGG